jgi:hypothetical protein
MGYAHVIFRSTLYGMPLGSNQLGYAGKKTSAVLAGEYYFFTFVK